MNREILFRGKRVDNEEWVEGVPVKVNTENKKEKCFIVQAEFKSYDIFIDFLEISTFEVIPSTVGQYTGLTDRNGVKIFEEDIVRDTRYHTKSTVKWRDSSFWLDAFHEDIGSVLFDNDLEVIGNVYDNPELLKGEENG
jgi:gp52